MYIACLDNIERQQTKCGGNLGILVVDEKCDAVYLGQIVVINSSSTHLSLVDIDARWQSIEAEPGAEINGYLHSLGTYLH